MCQLIDYSLELSISIDLTSDDAHDVVVVAVLLGLNELVAVESDGSADLSAIERLLIELLVQSELERLGLDGRGGGEGPLIAVLLQTNVWLGGSTDFSGQ